MNPSPSYTKIVRELLVQLEGEGTTEFTMDMLLGRLEKQGLGTDATEKRRVRDAVKQLKRKGEVTVTASGFRYTPETRTSYSFERIYRAIRAYKGAFTTEEIARLSETPMERTGRVITSLAASGYVKETGFKNGIKVWISTSLCRNEPTPPPINYSKVDFEQERRAAARLVEIFLVANPKHPASQKVIKDQLDILNRRFGPKGVSNDN